MFNECAPFREFGLRQGFLPRHNNCPLAKRGFKKHRMDFHGDHTGTCRYLPGASKAHDWMVSVLGPLFRTAGHTVRTQFGVTARAGQHRGNVEVRKLNRNYLLRDRGALHCHWNAIASQQLGHVPFSPRGSLRELEQQSRTRGCRRPKPQRCGLTSISTAVA